MTCTTSHAIGQLILNAAAQRGGTPASMVREDAPFYAGESLGDELRSAHWTDTIHTDDHEGRLFMVLVYRKAEFKTGLLTDRFISMNQVEYR